MNPNLQSVKQRFGIIGNSPGLNYALSVAIRVAATDLAVLIQGESGVGKEIFSKIIHQLGARKHNQFIAVNCGAIPEGTIDSELFGHEKGAFTGASDSRKGYFEFVNGGTIFLDEIGEMPLGTQARLLRVLESGEFIKVGSSKVLKTDVRVIAATNVDLLDSVERGRFREDLYYRMSTVPIKVPPLRERKDDIYILFRKFASDFAEKNGMPTIRLTPRANQVLTTYTWPGNIRELKNIAEQVSVLSQDNEIGHEELMRFIPDSHNSRLPAVPASAQGSNGDGANFSERELLFKLFFDMKKDLNDLKKFVFDMSQGSVPAGSPVPGHSISPEIHHENMQVAPVDPSQPIILEPDEIEEQEVVEESLSLADKEKELISKALDKHRGRRKAAAKDLGISERTLYRKIKEYEIPL